MKKFFLLLSPFIFSLALGSSVVAADTAVIPQLSDKEIAQVEEIAMLAKQQNLSDEHVAAMVKDALHEEADVLPFECPWLLANPVLAGAVIVGVLTVVCGAVWMYKRNRCQVAQGVNENPKENVGLDLTSDSNEKEGDVSSGGAAVQPGVNSNVGSGSEENSGTSLRNRKGKE